MCPHICVSAADEKKKSEFEEQSLFRGINYVFDNRIGQLVTADVPLHQLPSSLHQLPSSRSTSAAAHTRLEGAEERGGEVVCDEGGRLAAAPAGPEPQVLCLLC